MSVVEARMRNVRGLDLDGKGALPDGGPIKEQSTEARPGVGAAHSSEELRESAGSEGAASSGLEQRVTAQREESKRQAQSFTGPPAPDWMMGAV